MLVKIFIEYLKYELTKNIFKHILTISKMIIYFLEDGDYMLLDYLVKNYEKGEPIFLADISIKEEIISNYAPALVREVSIKNRKYVIRKPVVEVTEENAYVLQFLDCLKDIDKSAEEDMKVCGEILTQFAIEHSITKNQVDRLLCYYPLKVYKAIYETEVKYVSA